MKYSIIQNPSGKYRSKYKIHLCAAILFSLIHNIFCQLPNGTLANIDYINLIKSNIDLENQEVIHLTSNEINYNLTIDVYIINNELGFPMVQPFEITRSINLLNTEFNKIGINFKSGLIKYVPEYIYGKYTTEDQINEITTKYSSPDKINLYLVDTILQNENLYYGFTYFPDNDSKNYIFLRKEYMNGNYIITLMGHYFGLLSTHETLGGVERVNGTNCRQAGDFICDTYADPGLYSVISDSCTYDLNKLDPAGDSFIPTVANYMSESPDKCKCKFTPDQFKRMLFCLKNYRAYLK